jgi:site-specific recombinase XerC
MHGAGLRFHDLRHSAATLLLGAGVHPKIVSERLGHATVAITFDTYSHVLPDMQREAAAALDAALHGLPRSSGRCLSPADSVACREVASAAVSLGPIC